MRSAKEYRTDLTSLVARADEISKEWDGKEEEPGFEESMKELRQVLGKADEIKMYLELAMKKEGLDALVREPSAPGIAAMSIGREVAPGEGLLTDEQMEATATRAYKGAYESYLRRDLDQMGPQDRKTLQEGQDDAGGFTVPVDWRADLLKRLVARPNIRANATVITTSRDSVRLPKIIYTGDFRYTSGVRIKWVGETPASASEHRVTDPVFGAEQVQIYTAMASLPITLDLLEDSAFAIENYIIQVLGEAYDLGEESVWISGTGAGQPQGILTHPQVAVLSADTGDGMHVISGSAAALTADALINLAYEVPEQYDVNSKWYFNKRNTENAIRVLQTTDGRYLWPVINQVGYLGPTGLQLLGYPIVRTPFMPNIGAGAYPILFGDMTAYRIVDRIGLSIQRLRELYAETNLVVYLCRKRVGAKLLEPWRLKAQKCST